MTEVLQEAYHRLHRYGPEFGGDEEGNHGMTNHGPMAVEVMTRRGLEMDVDVWLDRYVRRLSDIPQTAQPVGTDWVTALGDAKRLPDWTAFFADAVQHAGWRDVLAMWWPRLLPGIVAGSTHGVIRVGHAVRTLELTPGTPRRETLDELAHGLAFWAARYRELVGVRAPNGTRSASVALTGVRRIENQAGLIADRLGRLERTSGWAESLAELRPTTTSEVRTRLVEIVDAAAIMYAATAPAAPVLLVHAATAPNAVLHVLPSLPARLWLPSLTAAWTAAAAVVATYAPQHPAPRAESCLPTGFTEWDALDLAASHGDEHVLKFADTAVEAYERSPDPRLLAGVLTAYALIDQP